MRRFLLILTALSVVCRIAAAVAAPAASSVPAVVAVPAAPAAAEPAVPAAAEPAEPAAAVRCEISGPAVDEHVELMSIVARLSGYDEYCGKQAPGYLADIRRDLAPYASHPLIAFMKEEARSWGVSYDAVMSMAIRLRLHEGRFALVDEQHSGLDKRWRKVDKERFLELLSDFYRESGFHAFYAAHRPVYDRAVEVFRDSVLAGFHPGWYAAFYGTAPGERFRIILGINNGHGNYGVSRRLRGRPKEVCAIICYRADSLGMPAYSTKSHLSLLIHEFNHSFINPLLERHREAVRPVAEYLLDHSRYVMRSQAYGTWPTLVNESLVRAAVIRYMLDTGCPAEEVAAEMTAQLACGFRWIPELVEALGYYTAHRDEYPTLDAFYPELIRAFERYAGDERRRVAAALNPQQS